MDIEYLAVGNPTVDQLPDGSGVVGGTVVYAAVQAARLGRTARVIGNGDRNELAPLLPHDDRIAWDIRSSPLSTKFENITEGGVRHQRLHATAGPVDLGPGPLSARVVHLGPVDAEVDITAACAQVDDDAFVGVTPQGLYRYWGVDHVVHLRAVDLPEAAVRRMQAVVVGHPEAPVADALMRGVSAAGGIAVRTLGSRGCEVWSGDHHEVFAAPVRVDERDDTGAGDVFAAALFISLADGRPLATSVRFAQAAAAASVRGVSVTAIADEHGIEELLADALGR